MTTSSSSILKKLLLVFLGFAALYFAKEFLVPLALGGVLATLFLPVCKWLEQKKVPRALATFLCLLIILAAISGIGAMLGWQVSELSKDFAQIKQKSMEAVFRVQSYIYRHLGLSAEEQEAMLKSSQSNVTGMASAVAGSMVHVFTGFILMMVYFFLLLYYRVHIKQFLLKLAPANQRPEMEKVIYSAAGVSQQYLVGLAKMIVCLWILYGIGFSIVGVKNAFFFAVLCGLLEIVPFVGNITGTTLTVLVSAVQGASFPMLGGIVITYGVVQFIQGWVLEPLIVGPQVKINAMATIISLVVGELLWGIPGIVLAIPLTAMVKIVCDHVESLKPYGYLIGEIETKKKPEPAFIKKFKSWFKKKKLLPHSGSAK